MKRLWMIPALVAVVAAGWSSSASAAYCNAINYQGCSSCGGDAAVVSGGVVEGGSIVSDGVVAGGVVGGGVVEGAAPA
ncbi:MAG: hypothetical protein AAFN70_16790, partial [Planctomycetota bacterium]